MTTISSDNKNIYKMLTKAFGGTPKVQAYNHGTDRISVDILSVDQTPDNDITSYGTIGLSNYSMPWGKGEFETRLEIVGACSTNFSFFPNILASAAFNIIRTKIVCHPGLVMSGYVKEYSPTTDLPNLYFTAPFFWEDTLKKTVLQTKTVSWLLCFPISDQEARYLSENGDSLFEDLLQNSEVDVFDFNRKSCI